MEKHEQVSTHEIPQPNPESKYNDAINRGKHRIGGLGYFGGALLFVGGLVAFGGLVADINNIGEDPPKNVEVSQELGNNFQTDLNIELSGILYTIGIPIAFVGASIVAFDYTANRKPV